MATGNELVIYEMHIGTFHVKEKGHPGTFESAIEKMPYLKELGIQCYRSDADRGVFRRFFVGYNPAHPFAVEAFTAVRMPLSSL